MIEADSTVPRNIFFLLEFKEKKRVLHPKFENLFYIAMEICFQFDGFHYSSQNRLKESRHAVQCIAVGNETDHTL